MIRTLVAQLSQQELITIIQDQASQDQELAAKLHLKYGKTDLRHLEGVFKRTVEKYAGVGPNPFIEASRVEYFEEAILGILDLIQGEMTQGNYKQVLEMTLFLWEKLLLAGEYMDTTHGATARLLTNIQGLAEKISVAAKSEPEKIRQDLVQMIIAKSKEEAFSYRVSQQINLLTIGFNYLDFDLGMKVMTQAVEGLVKQVSEAIPLKLDLLLHLENHAELDALIKDSKKDTTPIKREIILKWQAKKAFEAKDYEEVLILAQKNNLEINRLYCDFWGHLLYKTYEELGQVDKQKQVALEMIQLGQAETYFPILKNLCGLDFDPIYNRLKESYLKGEWQVPRGYYKLLELAQDLEGLMIEVEKDPYLVVSYAKILSPVYPQVKSIYLKRILDLAVHVSEHEDYLGISRLIINYRQLFGEEAMDDLIRKLKEQSQNQPDFLEVLNRLSEV